MSRVFYKGAGLDHFFSCWLHWFRPDFLFRRKFWSVEAYSANTVFMVTRESSSSKVVNAGISYTGLELKAATDMQPLTWLLVPSFLTAG